MRSMRDGMRYEIVEIPRQARNTEFYRRIDDLRYKVADVPRQARDTEFYNQINDLSKIRGG